MMIRLILALSVLSTAIAGGCIFTDNKDARDIDKGGYTLTVSDSTHTTYPGGGGIFILQLHPDSLFSGTVTLAAGNSHGLNPVLFRNTMTRDEPVSEIVIKPDSTMTFGTYNLTLTHRHNNRTHIMEIQTQLGESIYFPHVVTSQLPEQFDQWLADNHPEYGIHPQKEWYRYSNHPMQIPGLPSDMTYLDDDWHVRYIRFPGPGNRRHFMLRKRGETTPVLAVEKNIHTSAFFEIPVSQFGVVEIE